MPLERVQGGMDGTLAEQKEGSCHELLVAFFFLDVFNPTVAGRPAAYKPACISQPRMVAAVR